MEEEKVPMIKQAMHYGAILGLFWVFKYLFFIGAGFSDFLFIYIYYVLNVGTFLMLYIFYFKYKGQDTSNSKGLGECMLFTIGVCFFASVFESGIIYAHYQFIHPEFFFEQMVAPIEKMVEGMPYPEEVKTETINIMTSKVPYILVRLFSNVMTGFFLSLFIGLIAGRRKA